MRSLKLDARQYIKNANDNIESNIDLLCPNNTCPARNIESLIHFVERQGMNIIGLGERIIEDFYNMGILTDFMSIYHLETKKEELMELEGFGSKSVNKLLDNIEESKKRNLDNLIYAIGIKGIGAKNAKVLAKKYRNINTLMTAELDELTNIDDIGPILANSVYEYFRNEKNIKMIDELKSLGLNMEYIGEEVKENELITGKKFVITGTLLDYSRDEIKDIISLYGGNTSESVSKKTDVVIVGEEPGSKYTKAQELGIEIWNQEKLFELNDIFTKYKNWQNTWLPLQILVK